MPKLTIDGMEVTVELGTSIIQAAFLPVIPAKAGIHESNRKSGLMDPRLRGDDVWPYSCPFVSIRGSHFLSGGI